MPAEEAVGSDPGVYGQEPSEEELAREEEIRSQYTLAELEQLDLDDPATPSRRAADGWPEPSSVSVPLEDLSSERDDGR
jgi:hypothetical protein